MVTPSLTLICCLLAQDPTVPPVRMDPLPSSRATANPTARRPRPAAPPARVAEQPQGAVEVYPPADLPFRADEPGALDANAPDAAGAPPAQPADLPSEVDSALPAGTRLEPAVNDDLPGSPAAVLADALAIRAQLEVNGAPLRLLDLLSRARDPRVRLPAIEGYWNVSLLWIAAHWQWSDYDCILRMEAMSPAAADELQQQAREAKFRARLAAASANWKQAELELTEAQQRLASLIRQSPNEPLPLAADLPHVGAYRTRFETLYAGQPAPERSLLIHRTLPLRETELRMRAQAVAAAHEALEAAEAGLQEGTIALETVFSCLDAQAHERQAFLAVVRKYNADIAEYALATPVPAADDQTLAARLIKLRREDGWRWEPRDPSRPSAATGGVASPIAVNPGRANLATQPAQHLERALPGFDRQRPTYDESPPVLRGEE